MSVKQKMERVVIPVSTLEFVDGGNTIWIHDKRGGTALRIKTTGKIVTSVCEMPVSHSDVVVERDIHFCLSENASSGRGCL